MFKSWYPLLGGLPEVRGQYLESVNLSKLTWFKVGGPAQVLFKPQDKDDLALFVKGCPPTVPVSVMGIGSNLLVRDGGIPGVTIKLGRSFLGVSIHGNEIDVGGGTLVRDLAFIAQSEGLSGLEFMVGIPGTVGGSLYMNAGCYGKEMKDCLVAAYVVNKEGNYCILTQNEIKFSYRHCSVPSGWVFTGARFKATNGSPRTIMDHMLSIIEERKRTQPTYGRTCGSSFVNPAGLKAWKLIDEAGCRGLVYGGAQVSSQHCNFLVNNGSATAADIEKLGEDVRKRVLQHVGVSLDWEIKRVGLLRSESLSEFL